MIFERSPDSYREHRFNGFSQIFIAHRKFVSKIRAKS